jgi:hypothetical protein
MLNMNKINLYNQDGSLCSEAQLLILPKPDDVSLKDWKKRLRMFRSFLSTEDVKLFQKLRRQILDAITHIRKQTGQQLTSFPLQIRNNEPISLYDDNGVLCEEARALLAINIKSNDCEEERLKAHRNLRNFTARLSEKDLTEFRRLKRNTRTKQRRERNPERTKKDYDRNYFKNFNKIRDRNRKWRLDNPEKFKEQKRKECTKPENKLRNAVRTAFKKIGQNKPTDTLKLLGCTWEEAKAHFERLFQEGMTWENHGRGEGKWQIDHIRPVASFKGASEEELKQMNHISNLQPLWTADNLSKSDKWDGKLNSERLYSEV